MPDSVLERALKIDQCCLTDVRHVPLASKHCSAAKWRDVEELPLPPPNQPRFERIALTCLMPGSAANRRYSGLSTAKMATRPCASEWTPHPNVLPRADARRHACPLEKNCSRAFCRSNRRHSQVRRWWSPQHHEIIVLNCSLDVQVNLSPSTCFIPEILTLTSV